MTIEHDPPIESWWATGDTPVRNDSRVTYLIDGRTALLHMCYTFFTAQQYIYLANWGMTAEMALVRGNDHLAGPQNSSALAQQLAELRTVGLQQADIDFWQKTPLTVKNVLGYVANKGIEVKVLLWRCLPFISNNKPEQAVKELEEVGVSCILDDSALGIIHHPVESLHQKIAIIDGRYAFVGGVDPLIEAHGDYDRWDTSPHPFTTPLRKNEDGMTPHPWHDAHALIEGPLASDVEYNFRQRWNNVAQRHHLPQHAHVIEHPPASAVPNTTIAQIARTIPEHTYTFDPLIVRGIAQLYANALGNIRETVYLENQYFWLHAYTGIDVPFAGSDSPEMEQNLKLLSEALERGALMTLILPDHPNVGRAFSDAGLRNLRQRALQAREEGRLQVFCLATSDIQDGRTHYRPIYVHAKVAIIDDLWSTVGSCNLNNRGMRDDTEINVATLNRTLARQLRLRLQAEHLGLFTGEELEHLDRFYQQHPLADEEYTLAAQLHERLEAQLGDPRAAQQRMHQQAWENLQRYKTQQPLVGHLLPYFTIEEGEKQGLSISQEHGWIEERKSE